VDEGAASAFALCLINRWKTNSGYDPTDVLNSGICFLGCPDWLTGSTGELLKASGTSTLNVPHDWKGASKESAAQVVSACGG
jgi:hypothetical protein